MTFAGIPPEKFTYEFYNKEKEYNTFGPLTPQEFYDKHVRPLFDVNDKVTIYYFYNSTIYIYFNEMPIILSYFILFAKSTYFVY